MFTLLTHPNSTPQLRPMHPHHPGCRCHRSATQQRAREGLSLWTFPHKHQIRRCLLPYPHTRALLDGPSSVVSQEGHAHRLHQHQHPHGPNLMVLLTIAHFPFHSLDGRAAPDDQPRAHELQYLQMIIVKIQKSPYSSNFTIVTPSSSRPVSELFTGDAVFLYSHGCPAERPFTSCIAFQHIQSMPHDSTTSRAPELEYPQPTITYHRRLHRRFVL